MASQRPSPTRTLSIMKLVWKESPAPVRSDIGVPGAMAPGSGKPSCFARRIIDSVNAPPADVPNTAMRFGSAIFNAPFHTATTSSSAAG
jgi:hypothetical protein